MSRLSPGAENYQTVGVLLPPPMIDRISGLAAAEGLAKSSYVRRLLLAHLAEIDAAKAAKAAKP